VAHDAHSPHASASQIMLIRHAEKPPDAPPPHGVSAHGDRDEGSLTVRGWQRAGALVSLFTPGVAKALGHGLSVPSHLYCISHKHHSKRTRQTLTPLARKLEIPINDDFSAGEEEGLARHARARSGAVLICWRHHHLHTLAQHIAGDHATVPRSWSEDRYDVVWVLDLDRATGEYTFRQVAQELLDGDVPAPATRAAALP
jgi:hypothetical protein